MSFIVISSERFAEHQTPPGHPECPERAEVMDVVAGEWRKRDPDNVSSGGRKIILDSLQECGLLENDNATWVLSFVDTFKYGKDVGVVLTVK